MHADDPQALVDALAAHGLASRIISRTSVETPDLHRLTLRAGRFGHRCPHVEVVDWATRAWLERTGSVFRDPDRAIRKLYQVGKLQKITIGIYMFDPSTVATRELEDFDTPQRRAIFRRDACRCVISGYGEREGFDLHDDHIKPNDRGGKAEIANGQALRSMHNTRKKNLSRTETGKKMFVRIYDAAKASGDDALCEFIREVPRTYEAHGINRDITWRDPNA